MPPNLQTHFSINCSQDNQNRRHLESRSSQVESRSNADVTATMLFGGNVSAPKSILQHDVHMVEEPSFLILPNPQQESQAAVRPAAGKNKRKESEPQEWRCPASTKSTLTVNPISTAIEPLAKRIRLSFQRADGKHPISLASGTSTVDTLLPPFKAALEASLKSTLSTSRATASYANACGTDQARLAIAKHHSYPELRSKPADVIVANGCSGALELALTSLLDPGTILLVPKPGFPLYQTIAESHGAQVVQYRLDIERNWECDTKHLEELMSKHSSRVRAMVINNPSGSTGSVFSEAHLMQILEFARKHRLPIVSDEVYGDLTLKANKFLPIAQVAARMGRQVPIITTSGLSKQFLVPGWRAGWLVFSDNRYASLRDVINGAARLAQISHGPSNLVQNVIPSLLNLSTPGLTEWKQQLRNTLEIKADCLCSELSSCHGLQVVPPQGAVFAMVKIDTEKLDLHDDMDFATRLLDEENVFALPGSAIGSSNCFRVSYSGSSQAVLKAASKRISAFCKRHEIKA